MGQHSVIRSVWKVIFCISALLEIQYIVSLMRKAEDGANDTEPDEYCHSTLQYNEENGFSVNYTFLDRAWESTLTLSHSVFVWAGPFFCSLCIVESLVRAVEARAAVLENRVLQDLEESLLRAAQKSSVRLSMFFIGADSDQGHKKAKKVSKALRSWIPAISTIAFWLFLLPTDFSDFHHRCGSQSLNDSAVVTQWINGMLLSISGMISTFRSFVESIFWTKILPYRIHKHPQRFIQRLQIILRWIRFARFAGPLFRMGLKLQDQIRAVWKARNQASYLRSARQERIDTPSLIRADISRLFRLAKLQTALARVPSFHQSSPRLNKISASVIEAYNKKRTFGKNISKQLTKLQRDYLNFSVNESFSASSDLYDRIVRLSQDITSGSHSEKGKYSHRYLKSLRALLSSREYLISPRTRFSLAWRMTVSNCLLLEIARLCASWHLSGSFSISLSQIVGRLLVDCKAPEQTKHHLAFLTDQINRFRRHMFEHLPIFGPPPVDIAVCIPSGPQALLLLHFGRMLEFFVDVIVFLDIFVWFLTGDIEHETHAIIPKPFFTRCILPGTLVQMLDHPTLPDLLPGLLKSTLAQIKDLGYSRCLRWTLALVPAFKMLVFEPMTGFFFKHIEEDKGLMHIAESVGMLTPERKSGMLYRSTGSLGAGAGDDKRDFFRRMSSHAINTSQVGLALDSSPTPSRYDLQSMVSADGSLMDGMENFHFHSSLQSPTFSGMAMQNSPLKKRKSVHFGFGSKEEVDKNDVGYSLSASELRASTSSNNDNALESSLVLSRHDMPSMSSTDGSSIDGMERLPSPLQSPIVSGVDMQSSYLANEKTVHFGLGDNDDNENRSASKDEIDENDLGYSFSAGDLQTPTPPDDDIVCQKKLE
mmetsp:Transcript_19636/g.41394  ORF Transcript_19636/g.41394 Transcript_19636/m.41394 type:complete len:877 (+) Transcript_19636:270-2900(+)